MLNLIQHLTKLRTYETLKGPMKQVQGMVQGDRLGLFTNASHIKEATIEAIKPYPPLSSNRLMGHAQLIKGGWGDWGRGSL